MSEKIKVTRSSGNVFADLGLPNADERLAKADLAIAIKRELDARKWTQAQAAEYLFLTQPQVSKIRNGKLEEFSRDTLQKILRNLGIDVEISLHKREDGGIGTLRVLQAG
ncbi:MAG: helix-turn-helix domain-containing protein [Vulcanimicrobiaceae bacterium]